MGGPDEQAAGALKTLLWILGLTGGFAAFTLAVNLPRRRRLRKLATSRAGMDAFARFRESLPGTPEELLRRVYGAVQDVVPGKDVPLQVDDTFFLTLEVDQGDFDDLLEELLVEAPGGSNIGSEPSAPIATVGDLARAVWRSRLHESS
jgi:hypothetical protein